MSHRVFKNQQVGVTLFEGLITAFILFLILSAVVTLLQTSLRAMKNQQGREISEVTFVQEMLRRDLSDALAVVASPESLVVRRSDHTVPWQELLVMTGSPASLPPLEVTYRRVGEQLVREVRGEGFLEPLLTVENFESSRDDSDIQVKVVLMPGQRQRSFVWNFWCPAL